MSDKFLDIHFPAEGCVFERQSLEFLTNIQNSKNGLEVRTILADSPKIKYFLEESILSYEKVAEISTFFQLAKGRGFSFRFQDEIDFKAESQAIDHLGSYEFILTKEYKVGNFGFKKVITKPKKGSLSMFFQNSQLVEGEDFEINYNSGKIIFFDSEIVEKFGEISAFFDFDYEVRFESDEMKIEKDRFGNLKIKNLILVEVL